MGLFKLKNNINSELFESFFEEVKDHSFEITSKNMDDKGEIINTNKYDVIKLKTLANILKEHFGVSLKISRTSIQENEFSDKLL